MSEAIETVKCFKKYEAFTAIAFLAASVMFCYQADWLASIVSLCGTVWVFISSGNRQNFEAAMDILESMK